MVTWKRHLIAFGGMLGGCSAVFSFVLLMNAHTRPPPSEDKIAATAFEVKKEKKPKPKKREARPKPRRQRHSSAKAAPRPALASSISSVAIAMPGFDSSQLGDLAESVVGADTKNVVMDEGSVDKPPKAVSRVAPSFPEKARQKGITGYVTLNLLIGISGEVERVRVLEAQPAGVFEEDAVASIQKWRFAPAEYQAEHVKVWAKQTLRFELN